MEENWISRLPGNESCSSSFSNIWFSSLLAGHGRFFTLVFGFSSVVFMVFMTSLTSWLSPCYVYLFLFTLTTSRSFVLFVDPYHSEKFFSSTNVHDAVSGLDFPCIASSIAFMVVIIKKLTRQSINHKLIKVMTVLVFINFFLSIKFRQAHFQIFRLTNSFFLAWTSFLCYSMLADSVKLSRSLNISLTRRLRFGSSASNQRSASQDVTLRVYYVTSGIKPQIRIIDENDQSYSYHSEHSASLATTSPKSSLSTRHHRPSTSSRQASLCPSNAPSMVSRNYEVVTRNPNSVLFFDGRINGYNKASQRFVEQIFATSILGFLLCLVQLLKLVQDFGHDLVHFDEHCGIWLFVVTLTRIMEVALVALLGLLAKSTEKDLQGGEAGERSMAERSVAMGETTSQIEQQTHV